MLHKPKSPSYIVAGLHQTSFHGSLASWLSSVLCDHKIELIGFKSYLPDKYIFNNFIFLRNGWQLVKTSTILQIGTKPIYLPPSVALVPIVTLPQRRSLISYCTPFSDDAPNHKSRAKRWTLLPSYDTTSHVHIAKLPYQKLLLRYPNPKSTTKK